MGEAELWAEYTRLLEADDFHGARRILDQIPPVSGEEFRKKLDGAPLDDEPVSEELLRRFEDFEATRARLKSRPAG